MIEIADLVQESLRKRAAGETVEEYSIEEGDTKRQVKNSDIQSLLSLAKYADKKARNSQSRSVIRLVPGG